MASRSLNRVILIGNLTRDPELKYTPTGTPICTFGIATNRSWTTSDGQTKDEVQYHRIVAWQKLAELCAKLLTKGKKVYLEGRLTYRTFTGKDNQERTVAEIVLEDFIVFNGGNKKIVAEEKTTEKPEEVDQAQEESEITEELPPEEEVSEDKKENEDNKEEEKIDESDIPF